jgi:LysM repeat protein
MKMPSIMKRRKLHASTARRARTLGLPDGMDYEQMSEPNMKLSRALLIVLVLHVVAVAGIIAFNTIKTRESMTPGAPGAEEVVRPTAESIAFKELGAAVPTEVTKVTDTPEGKGPEKTIEPITPMLKTPAVADSGKIYTVVKGDNPVTIARHLKVSEADLLELNQISDPRKLQIGTKLRIPARVATTKGKSE